MDLKEIQGNFTDFISTPKLKTIDK